MKRLSTMEDIEIDPTSLDIPVYEDAGTQPGHFKSMYTCRQYTDVVDRYNHGDSLGLIILLCPPRVELCWIELMATASGLYSSDRHCHSIALFINASTGAMSQILAEMGSGDTIHSPAESQPPQDFNVTEGARRRSDALKAGAASLWEKGWGSLLVPSLGSSLSMQRQEIGQVYLANIPQPVQPQSLHDPVSA